MTELEKELLEACKAAFANLDAEYASDQPLIKLLGAAIAKAEAA